MDLASYSVRDFDRGASRGKEIAWQIVKLLFFQNPLPLPSSLRVEWLRIFGAKIGRGVVIRANVNISFPWRLELGDHVWIGEEVMILSLAPVTIEAHCCVSQRAFLCTGSHHFSAQNFDLVTRPIMVRTGCWIAAQTFVGPGVEMGAGSVASAGSVVLENVPPRSLVRGNPATVVKQLS